MAKCKECGWNHPATAGPCPAAKLKSIVDSKKGKAIAEFMNLLMNHLQNLDNWDEQIKLIKNILKL